METRALRDARHPGGFGRPVAARLRQDQFAFEGELLLGLGVPTAQHQGLMSAVAPGWKLRVLLAQALFGDPDILLLDEPTNNLDINGIRCVVYAGSEV